MKEVTSRPAKLNFLCCDS